jgi:hypothetical protein
MEVEVGGRKFKFVRPTISFLKRYNMAKMEEFFSELDFEKVIQDDEQYRHFVKKWKEFCGIAFERDLLWKMGFQPKELKAEKIPLTELARVVKDFFGYVGGGMS